MRKYYLPTALFVIFSVFAVSTANGTSPQIKFTPYQLGSNEGSIVIDGKITHDDGLGLPFSRQLVNQIGGNREVPLTGWVKDDGAHLYVSLDLSLGRVKQLALRDASVFIKQPNGVREYRFRDAAPGFGKKGRFNIELGKFHRHHQVYEFKIPLGDLHIKQGTVELAFSTVGNPKG